MHVHAPIGHLAYSNRWRERSPEEKLTLGGGLLLLASLLPALPWSLIIFLISATAALAGARIPGRAWLRFLAPQAIFFTAAVAPLVFTVSPFGWYADGVPRAAGLWLRGLACASCLSLLSLTTPVPDLLAVLGRAKAPAALVELAFLVYRLAVSSFALLDRLRLGLDLRLAGERLTVAAASHSAGNLLVRGIDSARRLERGAALRGVEGFLLLPPETRRSTPFLAAAIGLEVALLLGAVLMRSRFPW